MEPHQVYVNSSWIDITENVKDLIKELSFTNPMLNTDSFSFLESMSASEIMEPKLDPFYDLKGPLTIDQLIIPIFPSNLDDNIIIQLFMRLFCFEVSYLNGGSLLETTHSCKFLWKQSWPYFNETNSYHSKILVYIKSLMKSLYHLTKTIVDVDLFEDDDFQPTLSVYLGDDLDDESILSLFKTVDNDNSLLSLLLKFRLSTHLLLSKLHSLVIFSITYAKSDHSVDQQNGKKEEWKLLMNDANNTLIELIVIIQLIQSNEDIKEEDEHQSIKFAFNQVISKIIQNSPQRQLDILNFKDSVCYFLSVLQSLKDTFSLFIRHQDINYLLNLEDLLHSTIALSDKHLHVFTRSIYFGALQIYNKDSAIQIIQSLRFREFPSFYYQFDETQSYYPLLTNFYSSLSLLSYETIKIVCQNRNRIATKMNSLFSAWGAFMTRCIDIDEIYLLQNQRQYESSHQWLICWGTSLCSLLMNFYLSLLIETNLISKIELDYFYWYREYISNSFCIGLDRLRRFKHEVDKFTYENELKAEIAVCKDVTLEENQILSIANENLKKRGVLNPDLGDKLATSIVERFIRARGQMNRGCYKLLIVIKMLGLFDVDKAIPRFADLIKYTSVQQLHETRYRCFISIPSPSFLNFFDFVNATNFGLSVTNKNAERVHSNEVIGAEVGILAIDPMISLFAATSAFKGAKSLFDELRKVFLNSDHSLLSIHEKSIFDCIQSMTKVCLFFLKKGNFLIYISLLYSSISYTQLHAQSCKIIYNLIVF